MDRATRDKFAARTGSDITSGNACWETAPNVFAQLNKDFGPFDVDLTADPERALCDTWFGPGDGSVMADALAVGSWAAFGKRGYSNPPYYTPFVTRILAKARDQAEAGFVSTFLLPMRVTQWFKQHVLVGADELWFCDARLVFYENGQPRYSINKKTGKLNEKPDTAMFDSIIVRYMPRFHQRRNMVHPKVGIWHVPAHGTERSQRRIHVGQVPIIGSKDVQTT